MKGTGLLETLEKLDRDYQENKKYKIQGKKFSDFKTTVIYVTPHDTFKEEDFVKKTSNSPSRRWKKPKLIAAAELDRNMVTKFREAETKYLTGNEKLEFAHCQFELSAGDFGDKFEEEHTIPVYRDADNNDFA